MVLKDFFNHLQHNKLVLAALIQLQTFEAWLNKTQQRQ